MVKNTKQTSEGVAALASTILHSKSSSHIAKTLAASALAQRGTTKETGKHLEELAHKVMQGKHYAKTTKTLAASVLAQANKERWPVILRLSARGCPPENDSLGRTASGG